MHKNIFIILIMILTITENCKSESWVKTDLDYTKKTSIFLNDSALNMTKYINEVSNYSDSSNILKGIGLLDSAISLDSTYTLAYLNKVTLVLKLRCYTKALDILDILENKQPENIDVIIRINI